MKTSVKVLIIILSLIIVGLITFLITDAIIKNSRKNENKINVIENNLQENRNSITNEITDKMTNTTTNETTNTTTNETTNTTTNETTNNNKEAVEAIKTALKDNNWVKENVMMKESCFVDVPIKSKQDLTFMVLKSQNDIPIIAVSANSDEDLSTEVFLVTYKNGKVIANSITERAMHNGHAGIQIDPNNHIAAQGYAHMGAISDTYYDIKSGSAIYLDNVGAVMGNTEGDYNTPEKYYKGKTETECTKNEYDEIIAKYKKYKFYSIETELTDSNIDKYIK